MLSLKMPFLDFLCIDGVDVFHSMQEPKGEAYDNTEEVTEGGVTSSLDLRNEYLVVENHVWVVWTQVRYYKIYGPSC